MRGDSVHDVSQHEGSNDSSPETGGTIEQQAGTAGEGVSEAQAGGRETEDFLLKFEWETVPLGHGEKILKDLRDETGYGARILQKRIEGLATTPTCSNEKCKRPIRNGAWFSQQTHRDRQTGLLHTVQACSERCWVAVALMIGRPVATVRGEGMVRG